MRSGQASSACASRRNGFRASAIVAPSASAVRLPPCSLQSRAARCPCRASRSWTTRAYQSRNAVSTGAVKDGGRRRRAAPSA
jgi:hypothetical protein